MSDSAKVTQVPASRTRSANHRLSLGSTHGDCDGSAHRLVDTMATTPSVISCIKESPESATQSLVVPRSETNPSSLPLQTSGVSIADSDDVTSRAALALAAVAAAATANNSSPSAAAEAARAVAPGIASEASTTRLSDDSLSWMTREQDILEVQSSLVKYHFLHQVDSTTSSNDNGHLRAVAFTLASGQNDSLLNYFLFLAYCRAVDSGCKTTPSRGGVLSVPNGNSSTVGCRRPGDAEPLPSNIHQTKDDTNALQACGRIMLIVSLMEEEYDGFDLSQALDCDSEGLEGIEKRERASPLHLPACLTPRDDPHTDATVDFFLACSAEDPDCKESKGSRAGLTDDVFLNSNTGIDQGLNKVNRVVTRKSSGVQETASSVLSSVISSVKRGTTTNSPSRQGSLVGVFRKKNRMRFEDAPGDENGTPGDTFAKKGSYSRDYAVQIDREMLGLTVENVLERTVVRTVLPGGAAKKAGARVGSIIVKVGNIDTTNLTHFETIDELRRSQRPLKLVLRQVGVNALQSAREEMGRLVRGGGFSSSMEEENRSCHANMDRAKPRMVSQAETFRCPVGDFSAFMHMRWRSSYRGKRTTKDEAVAKAGEKLVWILTMLVAGLERQSARISLEGDDSTIHLLDDDARPRSLPTQGYIEQRHNPNDFADASRSVSKVLFDFTTEKLNPTVKDFNCAADNRSTETCGDSVDLSYSSVCGDNLPLLSIDSGRVAHSRVSGAPVAQFFANSRLSRNKVDALLRIGDVLHRTRSFLADSTSPPAMMLRGEVISLLCDVLDIDNEMELSEEEAASSIAGHKAGPINDLGSAGSLLKLIILNCSTVPDCKSRSRLTHEPHMQENNIVGKDENHVEELYESLDRVDNCCNVGVGNRFLAVVHRLAASRSTSARVTACSLGPVLWGYLDFPHQLQLRGIITRALHDAEVIVRKSTATVLHEIAELVFDTRAVPWLVLMCERVMTDPEPQLRAAAMTLTWHLAEHLPNAFLGDARKGSRSLRRLPPRSDPTFAEVYLLQCKLLPVATRLADDRAPSVRLAVAAQCDRLCSALGEHWASVIIDLLQALLADADERVRSEAILCVPRLVEIVLVSASPDATPTGGVGVLEALLPVSMKLLRDPSSSVRVSLATSAGELLTLLVGLESLDEISSPSSKDSSGNGREISSTHRRHKKHVDETLIPLVQKLLHDPDPEVTSSVLRAVTNASRGNVREIRVRRYSTASEDDMVSLSSYQSHTSTEKKDPVFIPVLSETQVLRLLPTLSDLANSRQWRVRQSAVEIVPALLGCTHRLETRSEIAQLCIRLMSDSVDAVRRTAAECLCLGGGSLGSLGEDSTGEWIVAIVLPRLKMCRASDDPRQRMLSLRMIEVILLNGVCPSTGKAVRSLEEEGSQRMSPFRTLVEIALSLCADRTVNVRLTVGRVMGNLIGLFEEDDLLFVTEALLRQIQIEEMREGGGDRDVLYFARHAVCRAQMRLEDVSLLSGGG